MSKEHPKNGGLAGALGLGEGSRDHVTILSGTVQNVVGLVVFAAATVVGIQVLISRGFGAAGAAALAAVTLGTQLAWIASFGTRFGMDMASVRRVAIDVGKGEPARARAVVRLALLIALVLSVAVGLVVFLLAPWLSGVFKDQAPPDVFRAAAVALPFIAASQVILGGSRGLKIMRHTLVAYWVGQPVSWIVLTVIGWQISKTTAMTVAAFAASWVFSAALAELLWRRETHGFDPQLPAEPGEVRALIRYGGPRAPAALLSQALFWADYFVLSHYRHGPQVGVYSAAIRMAQALVLFLSAVSYMFSPFVADLHERGERDRLNGLFKSVTRWTLAGTIPLLLLLLIAPAEVLQIFGTNFTTGTSWLRILLIGQIVNVSVGAAGFVLIMAGRTGWDLFVYALSFVLDLVLAIALVPHLGPTGAAIAQTTTLAVSNALRLYLVWRFVHIQPYNRYYARLAIPAAIGAVAMLGVHAALGSAAWYADLVGTGAVGALAYYGAFLLLGLTPTEKGALMRVLNRSRG